MSTSALSTSAQSTSALSSTPPAAPPAASTAAGRGAPVSQVLRTLRFATASIQVTMRQVTFLVFTIALPIAMFLMFNGLFGRQSAGGTTVGSLIMINMAAYGGFGAAINAGAMIQLERANGWLRQLVVAGLKPSSFVVGKLIAAMAVVLPALLGVFLVGTLAGGVRITWAHALASLAVLWVCMVPLVLMGLALGLALKPSAVQAAATIGLMGLSILGGLWMPADMFPGWMQQVARVTPTYWIGQLGAWPVSGGHVPVQGILVLLAWGVGLAVISGLLLRRAAATSSRR